MRFFTILSLFSVILISCKPAHVDGECSEGVITYNISYIENKLEKVSTPILPKKMTLKFNHKKSVSTIDGFLGFLKIISITDFKEQEAKTFLKVFDNEFVFLGEEGETICCYNKVAVDKVEKIETDTVIAGFDAEKAIVHLMDGNKITVYYTMQTGIKNPNANNPYFDIDGVLLDFQLTMNQLKMRFIADDFETRTLKAEDFDVYENPKRITRESMTKILAKLME